MRQEIHKYYHKSKGPLSTDTDSAKLGKNVLHGQSTLQEHQRIWTNVIYQKILK